MNDKPLVLTKIHNALNRVDRDTVIWEYAPNQSLLDIKKTINTEVVFAASLNGILIPEERLCEVYPRPGDHILFVPTIMGGGSDGKMVLRIVAIIVVAVLAAYTGGAAGALYGPLIGGMASAAVMVVGGILVNMALPMPKPSVPTIAGNDYDKSNTYSWAPQTLQQQGVSIPRSYGRCKLYGNAISGYLESDGDKQYLNALVSLGIGPFFDIPSSGMKINEQPIDNFRSSISVPQVRLGTLNQTPLSNFEDTRIEHALSQKITVANSPYIYEPSGTDYNGLEVEITFPQGLYEVDQSSGAFKTALVSLQVSFTNGVITKYVEWVSEETTSTTPGTYTGWSLGKWVSGMWNGGTWYEALAGPAEIRDPSTGQPWHNTGDWQSGYQWSYFENLTIQVIRDSRDVLNQSTISGASQKVMRKIWRIYGLEGSNWEVHIQRITPDNSSAYLYNDFFISAVREIYTIPFQYPRQVLVGIDALGTEILSGSLKFSAICDCLYVRVCASDGVTWSVQYSNNPAWVLCDILTRPVYSGDAASGFTVVRYDGMLPARIDVAKFIEWADWCNDLVPDGAGGTEKRMTFNGTFDAETSVWDAALQVCQVGFAMLVWNGINLTLAIDKASDPVHLFSVGNTCESSFSEVFLPLEDRAAEIEMDFINSENDYARDKLTIVNGNINTINSKVGLQVIGISKSSEAWRYASRRLAYNQYLVRTVSFKADIDAIACTIGDVIELQSDVPQWGSGGRIVSAQSTSIILDQDVTIVSGTSYAIMVRCNDDSLLERTVTNAPGVTNTITVSSPFSPIPEVYAVYAFGETDIEAKPFKVIQMQKVEDLKINITCVEYNESIYGLDDGTPVIPTRNYSVINPLPPVTNLVLHELLVYNIDGVLIDSLHISFDNPQSSTFKIAEIWIHDDQPWHKVAETLTGFYIYENHNLVAGSYISVAILTVNYAGEKMSLENAPTASLSITGTTVIVPNVSGFELFGQGNNNYFIGKDIKLRWNAITANPLLEASGPASPSTYPTWFKWYELQIYDGIVLIRTEYLKTETYNYDYEKNYVDTLGHPSREVTFVLYAVGTKGDVSVIPARLTAINIAPAVVSGVVLTSFIEAFTVNFQPLSELDVAGYLIHANQISGFTPSESTLINRGPETSFFKAALPGEWFIKIAAYDTFGESALLYSPEYSVNVATLGPLDTVPPDDPTWNTAETSLETDGTTSKIALSWNLIEPEDFLQYNIQYDTSGLFTASEQRSTPLKFYELTGLVTGQEYYFQIQAVDKYNNVSNWVVYEGPIVAAMDTTAPSPVVGLVATSAFKSVFLTWDSNTESDLLEYIVEIANNETFSLGLISFSVGLNNNFTYSGVPGLAYYARVTPRDRSGNVPNTGGPADDGWSNVVYTIPGTLLATDIDNFSIDASQLYTNVPVIKEAASSIWVANTPTGGISWASHTVVYKSKIFTINAGSTTVLYVAADLSGDSGTISYFGANVAPSQQDFFVMAKNTSGALEIVWQAQANMVIGSANIMELAVNSGKISDLAVDKLVSANINATEYIGVNNGQIKLGLIGTDENGILVQDHAGSDVFRVNDTGETTLKNLNVDGTISVGDGRINLEGGTSSIAVRNADDTHNTVLLGKLATDMYGLQVNQVDGTQVFRVDEDGAVVQNATVGNLLVGPEGILCGAQGGLSAFKVWDAGGGSMNIFLGNAAGQYLHWNGTYLDINASIAMSSTSTISWAQVTGGGKPADNATVGATWGVNVSGAPTVYTQAEIKSFATTITNTTVTTAFVNALNVTANSVNANWVYAGSINANNITAGTLSANRIDVGNINAGSVNGLRMITGVVNSDGTIASGPGFTVSKLGTGDFQITFTTPFAALPVVLASITGASITMPAVISTQVFNTWLAEIHIYSSVNGSTLDNPFGFTAIGLK